MGVKTPAMPAAGAAWTQAIRADFPIFSEPPRAGSRLIYLDSAASAQKPRAMLERLDHFYRSEYANIHRGVYPLAEAATAAFENARGTVARFINARESAEIVWTRNATEAINLVTHSWGLHNLKTGDAIVLTELEHHSNLVPWQVLAERTGAQLRYIPIDGNGVHALDSLDALLRGAKIVSLTQISNTLGTIAPLAEIITRAHAAGSLVLVDGAQSAPHMPVDVQALGADFFVASGHKLCGPSGIGFLWGRRELLEAMPPFLTGGDMIAKVGYTATTYAAVPWKFEAGTGAIAEAAGLAASIEYLERIGLDRIFAHERELTQYAVKRLSELENRGLRMHGPVHSPEHAGIISFTFADIHPHDLASLLATDGVCVRAGHHCTMPLMNKLGLNATARASFYLYNGEDDVDALITGLHKAARIFGLPS